MADFTGIITNNSDTLETHTQQIEQMTATINNMDLRHSAILKTLKTDFADIIEITKQRNKPDPRIDELREEITALKSQISAEHQNKAVNHEELNLHLA